MTGEIAGLAAALSWAGGSLAIKTISARFGVFSLNAWRNLAGWVFLLAVLFPLGKLTALAAVPLSAVLYVASSGIVSVIIGSSLYIKSLALMDISKAYPITYSFWLLSTAVMAAVFLGEVITVFTVAGALLVIAGIVMLVTRRAGGGGRTPAPRSRELAGFVCALLGGLGWAGGGVLAKLAMSDIDPLLVNVIRSPVTFVPLFILALRQGGTGQILKWDRRSLCQAWAGGILDQGIASVLFFFSIQYAGVARATILSSTSPLFVAPFSAVLWKERLTWWTGLGTVLCVLGVWLTVAR